MFGEQAFMQSSYSNIQHSIIIISFYHCKPIEFSSQSGVILEHYTALIITLPHKGLGRYTDYVKYRLLCCEC